MKILNVLSIFAPKNRLQNVQEKVNKSIENNKEILEKLEKYDRGAISKPKNLVGYNSVQDYLRDVQKISRRPSNDGRTTSAI